MVMIAIGTDVEVLLEIRREDDFLAVCTLKKSASWRCRTVAQGTLGYLVGECHAQPTCTSREF